MDSQQGQQQDVRAQFAEVKKRQFIATPVFVLFLIPLVISVKVPEFTLLGFSNGTVFWVSLAVVAAGLIFSLFNWRCPACGVYLRKNAKPIYCPKCGAQLQDA